MEQVGNLAVVCAIRPDQLLRISGGYVAVHIDHGSSRAIKTARCDDDAKINGIIHEINFGILAKKEEAVI